jgi:signal transduction histidine kinase
MKSFVKETGRWLILFVITALTFILLTWLLRPEAIKSVSFFITLFTLFMISIGCILQRKSRRKKICAAKQLLDDPNEDTKNKMIAVTDDLWIPIIDSAYARIQKQKAEINDKQMGLRNYQEFIEAWTHEIKTPLSLMTLVIENHKDEMSAYTADRLEYVRLQISEDVERILYYGRLQSDHTDFNFLRFWLDECTDDVLSDFAPIAEEKRITFISEMQPIEVVSDRKVLSFIISQFISNAVKYAAPEHGNVSITIRRDGGVNGRIHLIVRDNGNGVSPEDLPFIFDKGFTGNHPDRQKATGMGLYLASKYAEALNIAVQPEPMRPKGFGFGIELIFPVVV